MKKNKTENGMHGHFSVECDEKAQNGGHMVTKKKAGGMKQGHFSAECN